VSFAVVAFALSFLFLRKGGALLKGLFGGKRDGEGGKWIRDRSLGGKMVWIPDAPASDSSAAYSPLPPTREDDVIGTAATAASLRSASTPQVRYCRPRHY